MTRLTATYSLAICLATAAEYRTIPASPNSELTPTLGSPSGQTRDWSRSHGDSSSSRYSKLDQINRDNVSRLEVAWTYRSGDGQANIEANPVIVKGVMYAPTAGQHVVAIDAATGREMWRFKPGGRPAYRGMIYWPGDSERSARLYFTSGGWLYALDAATGKPVGAFGRNGRVAATGVVAPTIYQRTLVIPCWNTVKAFDVLTGEERWSFNLIPRQGEFGFDTWSAQQDGANSWGGMALDEQRGIAFISAGSPHPNYLGMRHRGDNLFANCLIALNATTGKRLWHFQEIRHDIWDLDIPAPPNLVTVTREGRKVDAVAQVTKIGNTLLLDRVTGKPLFPFRLRRAPASKLTGEQASEWQPDVELPEPFARQEFRREDVTDISPKSRSFILDKIANATFGWFAPFEDGKPLVFYGMHGGAEWTGAAFDPSSGWLYVSANELPWVVNVGLGKSIASRDIKAHPTEGSKAYLRYCAACHGADRLGRAGAPNLDTVAAKLRDPQIEVIMTKGRNAMPPIDIPEAARKAVIDFLLDRDLPAPAGEAASVYRFNGYTKLLDQDERPGVKPPWGTLNAIDLNTGRIAWKAPLGEYEELTRKGMAKTGTENFGGAMVTAGGLVFCAGTRDLKIRAFDSRTGKELWEHKLPFGGFAPPATYEANGRQYVVIAATGGGKLGGEMGDAYVAFALPKSGP